MVRIRLRRVGSKGQPSYRIVVADKRSPRDGRFIEKIGFYNPRTEPATMEIDEERALHWLSNGAQPSDAVTKIMEKLGTLARYERLKGGEALDILVSEAAAEAEARPLVDPRTRRDDLERQPKKAQAAAEAEETIEEEVSDVDETTEEEISEDEVADVEEPAEAVEDIEPEVEAEAEPEVDAEEDAGAEPADAEEDAEAEVDAEAETTEEEPETE